MIPGSVRPGLIPAGWSWPLISPPQEEDAAGAESEHAIVSLRRRQLRILRRIERDIADSDPGLDALYLGFARRTSGRDMRWVEMIDRRRRWLFFRRRPEPSPGERVKDRRAENWNDP
jgi:hypothetical protein